MHEERTGFGFPFTAPFIVGQHADYWSAALIAASSAIRGPFLAPWDLISLGQNTTTQETLNNFVESKLHHHKLSALAADFRSVLVWILAVLMERY